MRYVLLLLLIVLSTLRFVARFCSVNTLLPLVILTVYVGAIITLFVYVRAICPNDYVLQETYRRFVLIIGRLVSCSVFRFYAPYGIVTFVPVGVVASAEIFAGFGSYITVVLTLVLLIVLVVCTYITPATSTFRSIS